MNRQLRYEGPRLDEILARIREDHGDDANIVAAEQVRTGGIAGFFQKEHYEVTVQPAPDPGHEPAPASEAQAVEAAPESTAPEAAPPAAPAPAAAEPVRPADPAYDPATTPFAARRAAIGADEPIGPVPGTRFADMLAELIEDRDTHTDTVELSAQATAQTTAAAIRAGGLRRPTVTSSSSPATPVEPAPAPAPADRTRPNELADVSGAPVAMDELIAMVTRRMHPAPELPREGLVAVVGARGDAVNAAVGLARILGQPASDVLVAAPSEASIAPEHMSATVRATIRQRERRGRTGPTIVVVVVEPGRAGHRWATSLLSLLDATQTRLALAGWRPVDRLARTVEGLGGVDVVDVVDLESADAPASLLDLGLPVGTIDGEPATVATWVAVIAASEPTEVVVVPPAATSGPPAQGSHGHQRAGDVASPAATTAAR